MWEVWGKIEMKKIINSKKNQELQCQPSYLKSFLSIHQVKFHQMDSIKILLLVKPKCLNNKKKQLKNLKF